MESRSVVDCQAVCKGRENGEKLIRVDKREGKRNVLFYATLSTFQLWFMVMDIWLSTTVMKRSAATLWMKTNL